MVDRDNLHDKIKIGWGIGEHSRQNMHVVENRLSDFDLVGSRDVGVEGADWVPCASCMSPLFDKEYDIRYHTGTYLNSRKPPRISPMITNRESFEDAIRFLAACENVITDSYHGMYWATLLGKPVTLQNPYCSKFYQMKDAGLEECREANIQFDKKVRKLI
jgi:hypothetical protein